MNFLEEIFNLLEFNDEQKQKALSDLNMLVKAKITNALINQLPENILLEIKQIGPIESDVGQKEVAAILKKHFKVEKIKEEEKNALGQVTLIYLDNVFGNASLVDKEKAKAIFVKYGIKV